MNAIELGIVLICYTVAAVRELKEGNGPMAWIWASYAASVLGFIAIRLK